MVSEVNLKLLQTQEEHLETLFIKIQLPVIDFHKKEMEREVEKLKRERI